MNKIRTKELLLLAASILVALVLAEIAARWLNISPFQTNMERHEFDPALGWKTKSAHTAYVSRRNYAHYIFYNRDGLPSGKNDIEKSASREQPSIALIGDSFIEGAYLPYEKTIASVLDNKTAKQVLNFGVDGYSPGQYLLSARQQLREYNVTDIVVFLFAHNDTPYVNRDSYQGYAKPLVTVPGYTLSNVPLKEAKEERPDRGFATNMLHNLALWSIVKPLVGLVLRSDPVITESVKYDIYEMEKALQLIGQIHIENPNASFYVYYIPDLSELVKKEVIDYNLSTFNKICAELNLRCISPSPFLVDDAKKLYIPIDHHFSELGAKLVADQLYELFEEEVD
jgi:hypothetical protein